MDDFRNSELKAIEQALLFFIPRTLGAEQANAANALAKIQAELSVEGRV